MEKYAKEHPVYEFGSAVWDLMRFSYSMATSLRDNSASSLGEREFQAFKRFTLEQKALRVYRGSWRLLWGAVDIIMVGAALSVQVADKF